MGKNNECKPTGGDCGYVEELRKQLTADAVEMVRCKDCKHYDGRPCGKVDWWNTANDFCSRAERRTDE